MRRAIKVLSVLAAVCAMAWAGSPVLASCPFSLEMVQGGSLGDPPGALLNNGATDVNGFFWELGFGDPADGPGNDSNSIISGHPAFTQADPNLRWIKGAPAAPRVAYDWFNLGVDNCISGPSTAIASTVLVYYIIDSNEDYAIVAAQGTDVPVPHNSLDLLVTGLGPNNNDVQMGSRTVQPHITGFNIVSDSCLEADVGPAVDGMNIFSDAGGPYAGVVDVAGLGLMNGGVPEACDPEVGCHLTCIARDNNLCWGGDTLAVASQAPGESFCVGGAADTLPCGPLADPSNFCAAFNGVCPPVPPVTTPFGPTIPGGCTAIGGPTVDDHAVARATRSRGFRIFRWEATQFAVSHWNLYDMTRRGGRRINDDVIARHGNNDGSVTRYEFVASRRDINRGRRFMLELVRTDGQTMEFAVELDRSGDPRTGRPRRD